MPSALPRQPDGPMKSDRAELELAARADHRLYGRDLTRKMEDRLHELLFGHAAAFDQAGIRTNASRLRSAVAVIIKQPAEGA